jgi:predicted dithiol-disulfide oxidoreductase (DUF899 family)
MPWMAVDAHYRLEGPEGRVSLLDVFEGRRQLILYRAFFEPEVHGGPIVPVSAARLSPTRSRNWRYLNARDVTLAYASRAP